MVAIGCEAALTVPNSAQLPSTTLLQPLWRPSQGTPFAAKRTGLATRSMTHFLPFTAAGALPAFICCNNGVH